MSMLTNSIGRTRMLLCILSFLCFSWLASAVLASIFGTVRGIVHDSQHHPIGNARVTLHARASDWQKEAITDDEGRFQIDAVPAGDRKSTRLNSSHGYISYAVFCLKKKKKKPYTYIQ